MNWPHTLVFTAKAPPSSSVASAQVLERLTSGIEENFGYVHQADDLPRQVMTSVHFPVKNAFGVFSRWPVLWRFEQFGWYQAAIREGIRQVAQSKWDVILACHPNIGFALAAAKVARIRGLPLVLYLMDLFAESRVNPVEKFWASFTEKRLMMQATSVICLTKGIQKYYSHKYNINTVLIQHCVTEPEIAEAVASRPSLTVGSPIIITYAGGAYQARLDSLVVVKQAVEKLNAQGYLVKLLILGKNDPDQLASWGIGGPYVSVRFLKDRSEFMEQLRLSDILLSTVAFKSAYPLQDQTCFPTKTFDYFLAGKPVLVVAPDDNDYVVYIKKNTSAMIVTTLNSNVVAEHIYQLATDMAIRKQLVDSGLKYLSAHLQTTLQASLNNVLVRSVET
jgi:glycosyltransferase involved in cell wall biosynthesis